MRRRTIPVVLVAAAFAAILALSGCGANLDRDVEIKGMNISVPSDWMQKAAKGNDESSGAVTFEKFVEDADDEDYTAIVIDYDKRSGKDPQSAQEALAKMQQRMEDKQGVVLWSVDEEDTRIIDGAKVTDFEYSFEKAIDHVSKKYEYQTAYVFDGKMTYQISVYGDDVSLDAIVDSIEL